MLKYLALALGLLSGNSPFDGRDYKITEDFLVSHQGTIIDVHPLGNGTDKLVTVKAPELYFVWPSLVIKTGNPKLATAKPGDVVTLNIKHTAGDVVLSNPTVTEGYFDALTDVGEDYFGFLNHEASEVKDIYLERVDSEGEIGKFSVYWINIVFSDNTRVRMWQKSGEVDVTTIAKPGDLVLVARARDFQEIHYQTNPKPFGNKKVYQQHWVGPNSNAPMYQREEYGDRLFNLNNGFVYRFN